MAKHLYWFTRHSDPISNFGDILGPYIFSKISNQKFTKVAHPSMRRYKFFIMHFLTVGSIISESNSNSVVWGSGIIRRNQQVRRALFLSVRGPITRRRLLELGHECPENYGDPALLLSEYFRPKVLKRYKLGIIPHFMDFDVIKKLSGEKDVSIIDVTKTCVEEIIVDILQCEIIVSSSLHGIIVAHAYGIPAYWAKFSSKLAGDDVKFLDYFSSVGIEKIKPLEFKQQVNLPLFYQKISAYRYPTLPELQLIEERKIDLIQSCPFNRSFYWNNKLRFRSKMNFIKNILFNRETF